MHSARSRNWDSETDPVPPRSLLRLLLCLLLKHKVGPVNNHMEHLRYAGISLSLASHFVCTDSDCLRELSKSLKMLRSLHSFLWRSALF